MEINCIEMYPSHFRMSLTKLIFSEEEEFVVLLKYFLPTKIEQVTRRFNYKIQFTGLICHFTTLKLSTNMYNTFSATALFTVFDFIEKNPDSMTRRN